MLPFSASLFDMILYVQFLRDYFSHQFLCYFSLHTGSFYLYFGSFFCWFAFAFSFLKPSLSLSAETETLAVGVDPSAQGLLEGMGLDGDTLAPMETDEPTATDPKTKSKLTPAMATRIKQIKPLLSGQHQ